MPTVSKLKLQQRVASQNGRSVMADKKNTMDQASTMANLTNLTEELRLSRQCITELESSLVQLQNAYRALEIRFASAQKDKCTLKDEVKRLETRRKKTYHQLRMARQTQA